MALARTLILSALVGLAATLAAGPRWPEAVLREAAATPAFTRVNEAIDPAHPAFEALRQLPPEASPDTRLAALLEGFASHAHTLRDDAVWALAIPPAAATIELEADRVLADEVVLQGLRGPYARLPDGAIDWTDRGPRDDPEWAWMLNRHRAWRVLVDAFARTGDERYRDRFLRELDGWLASQPAPRRLSFSPSWRPLEVARRALEVWPQIWIHLRDDPAFDPGLRLRFLAAILDHARTLREHASFWGGNHLLTENSGLAALGHAFPLFAPARDWSREAAARFTSELLAQTYPDGAYKELSNHYELVVLREAERFLHFIGDVPPDTLDLAPFRARVEAIWAHFLGVARPDGWGPLNNGADLEHNRREAAAFRPGDPAIEPREPVRYYPWAGHAVMTDVVEAPREWAFFDLGPYGSAHQHKDALHLSAWFADRLFLADSGRYIYQRGPWVDYFQGPEGHNTVLLDGRAPLQGPRTVDRANEGAAFTAGAYRGFRGIVAFEPDPVGGIGAARHARSVVYLPGVAWLILDEVIQFSPAEITFNWNFGPTVTAAEADTHLRLLASSGLAGGLRTIDRRGQISPPRGWYSTQYGQREPALQRKEFALVNGPAWTLRAIFIDPAWTAATVQWKIGEAHLRLEQPGKSPLQITVQPGVTERPIQVHER